jgi:hypothetical protein
VRRWGGATIYSGGRIVLFIADASSGETWLCFFKTAMALSLSLFSGRMKADEERNEANDRQAWHYFHHCKTPEVLFNTQ